MKNLGLVVLGVAIGVVGLIGFVRYSTHSKVPELTWNSCTDSNKNKISDLVGSKFQPDRAPASTTSQTIKSKAEGITIHSYLLHENCTASIAVNENDVVVQTHVTSGCCN